MPTNPFPAFFSYPKDWLTSARIEAMSLEAEGAFNRLLMRSWLGNPPCTIPDDDTQLAVLSRAGTRWSDVGPQVRSMFESVNGRLRNRKLYSVFLEMQAEHRKRSKAAKDREKRKREEGARGAHAVVPGAHGVAPSSSSSSSSSEKKKKKAHALRAEQQAGFDRFWENVHRKVGKAETAVAYAKLDPDEALLERMIVAIQEQQTWPGYRPGESYPMPDPVRWIAKRRWEDERPKAASVPAGSKNGASNGNGKRVYIGPTGVRTEVGQTERVHWLSDEEIQKGAWEGRRFGAGQVTLRGGGQWDR